MRVNTPIKLTENVKNLQISKLIKALINLHRDYLINSVVAIYISYLCHLVTLVALKDNDFYDENFGCK